MNPISKTRLDFTLRYSKLTSQTVKLTAEGRNAKYIASKLGIPVTSVAAYKAHLTRGTYAPFANVVPRIEGACAY